MARQLQAFMFSRGREAYRSRSGIWGISKDMIALLLVFSIVMSVGRNLFSKRLSCIRFGSKGFFICQSVLFLFGGIAVAIFGQLRITSIAPETLIYAITYGLLLICSQWFYTSALSTGNTGLCSTVYSLGFILPTLSGAVLWSEAFSFVDFIGILCAVFAIAFSRMRTKDAGVAGDSNKRYFIPLLAAMLASGGLGIVQKLQQKSDFADEKSAFLLIAFLLAALISLISVPAGNKRDTWGEGFERSKLCIAAGVGALFGCCNLLNTVLAGSLPSAIFFPTLNIGVIFLTLVSGTVIYKEKIRRNEIIVFIFCIAAILLLNIG